MKIIPLALVGVGIISGAYPKFKPQPFDMVSVRFCPETSNTPEVIAQLQRKGKKFKPKDFTKQEDAQAKLYQEYCRNGRRMLKSIWDEKAPDLELQIDSSSLIVKKSLNENKHLDIISYLISIGAFGAACAIQSSLYKRDSKSVFSKIKKIENNVISTDYNANRARQYGLKLDTQEWNGRELENKLIDEKGLSRQQAKAEVFEDEEFKLHIKSMQAEASTHDKSIAENGRDAAKARKESEKYSCSSKQNSEQENSTPEALNKKLVTNLIEALKQHEDGWLWYLVESFTPIIIWGKAGSYKSYTAATIALLKHYLIDAKIESIADIDFAQNAEASWKYLVLLEPEIYGNGIDWESYNEGYLAAIERSRTRTLKNKPIVSIWDELTNANGQFENASKIVPWVIATPRKRNEHTILLTHNLTQGCLGGCEKISDAIHSQTYRLNLKTTPDGKPLFKGVLEGLVNADGDELPEHKVTLPSWFRPETIHAHFNGTEILF